MTIELIISPTGMLTLSREVLDHLGIERAGKLDMALLPNRRLELSFGGNREDTEATKLTSTKGWLADVTTDKNSRKPPSSTAK